MLTCRGRSGAFDGLRTHDCQQCLGRTASIPLLMAQDVKRAFGETEPHLLQQTGLDAWSGHGCGDGRSPQAGLDGGADGLIGRQFQLDAKGARVDAEIGQGIFENRSRARSGLAQHPFARHQVARCQAQVPDPRVFGADDHDELVAGDGRAGKMLGLYRAFYEA